VNRARLGLALVAAVVAGSCSLFYTPPEATIALSKTEYEYGEEISVQLEVSQRCARDVTITWTLDDQTGFAQISDPYAFTFALTPVSTTQYRIEATIDDGKQPVSVYQDLVVKQLAFLGTWRGTSVDTPAYLMPMDVVGVWQIDRFEMYYLDANGGTEIRDFSARGGMTFPEEDQWITLSQEDWWDEGTVAWQAHVETLYAKYSFTGDTLSMSLALDMSAPPGTEEYTWVLTKVDDTTDPWW